MGGEEAPQLGQLLGAEGADRLLDQVVEQLLDEGGVRLLAAGQERREVSGAVKVDRLARLGSRTCRSRRSAALSPPFGIDRRRRSAPG